MVDFNYAWGIQFFYLPKDHWGFSKRPRKANCLSHASPNNPLSFLGDKMLDKGFLILRHTFYKETSTLSNSEFRLFIFLNSCYNSLGNKPFFITDKQITEYIGLSRESIRRSRKRLVLMHIIDYTAGKYRKSASIYDIKRTKSDTESASKWCNNNKEVNKKEIKKEDNLSLLQQTRQTYAKKYNWIL